MELPEILAHFRTATHPESHSTCPFHVACTNLCSNLSPCRIASSDLQPQPPPTLHVIRSRVVGTQVSLSLPMPCGTSPMKSSKIIFTSHGHALGVMVAPGAISSANGTCRTPDFFIFDLPSFFQAQIPSITARGGEGNHNLYFAQSLERKK